uniref:Uncharacterized protein n=1 Tax=Caenorhabditis japonica TaxID=281687 RepID=A0A8R1ELW4_CAEJA
MDQFCISNSKIAPHNYCPLVKNYGEDAYNYDTNKWFPQYHPVLNQTANAAYMRLYGQCRGIKEPLSVCAYNHMACTLKMRPRDRYSEEYTDCRQYLLNCITTATDFLMKSNPSCLNHVKKVIKMIKDDARKSGLPKALHWKYTLSSSSSQLQYFAISALSLMIFNF